ncbi:MAG: hypothetical protein KDK76_01005 [Chlamydiia bacterium]|nr:hypothetical protein [Chlamydiia bacterium]
MLYIDPTDITISGAANSPTVMYPGGPGTVTFTAAATPVNLLNTSVVANLALGNLTIDTNAPITSAAAGTITVTSAVNWSNANSLTLNGDSDVNLFNTVFNTGAAGTGALTVLSRTGDVNISAAVSNIPVLIGSQNGAVSVQSTCGDVNITAGNTASDHATIGSFTGNSFGPITVVAGRDLNMQGGIGTLGGNSSSAVIGRMGLNQPGSCRGDITVTVGRNATLIGGSTTGPGTVGGSSQIGHALGFLGGTDFHDGAIFFNVGGNLEMLAGLDGAAVIGNGIDNNGTVDNDIFINVGGHMYMHDPGGTGFVGATIGGFNFDGGWRQNIFLNVGLNLTMDARNGGFVTFQAFNNFGDFATEGIQRIHVGGDFTLIGGDNSGSSSQCYVLLHQPRMWTEVYAGGNIRCYNGTGENAIIGLPFAFNNNGDLGRLDIRAGGNLIMGGGPAKPTPGNDQVFNSQTQFVYLEADASFVSGQLWPAQSVINPCSGVNIFAGTPLAASSGNQSTTNPGIIGGDGLGGFAIDTGEYNFANATTISGPTWSTSSPTAPAAPVAGPNLGLSYSAETGLSILSSDRFADGAPCDFLIGATNTPNAMQLLCRNGDLTVDQFRNITIQPTANPFSPQNPTTVFSGDVLIIANNDIYMDPQSRITSANNLTLVCDNQAPVAPQIGGVWSAAGRFIMDATASLVSNTSGTGGELRVYTALQAANSILGTLNGALFFAGIRFFDTDIEQWCTYYPGGTPGSVFKIYYKPCEQIPPLAQIPIAELFFDLHGPDEYLGWPEEFKYQFYDVNEKGLWALFNHLPDEGYFIRRKFYYMNNPKSSRDFIELYTQTTSKVVRVYEKR